MLVHLAIQDLAIIASTAMDFAPGLNVITGETGAGKSIAVGALNLVMGGRAKSTSIRLGCDQAEVQALFRVKRGSDFVERLRDLELLGDAEGENADIIIRRIISRNGRGRVWINGVLVNVSTLAELAKGLVDISSQHEHATLLDATAHLDLLDRFGGLSTVRTKYTAAWHALCDAKQVLKGLTARDSERLQREDFLRFQLSEIEDLSPVEGEEEALRLERDRLAHAKRLMSDSRAVENELVGRSRCVQETLVGACDVLSQLSALDTTLSPLSERLEEARIELADIAYELRAYSDQVALDPNRLESIEERLHALIRLSRKHGLDPAGLVEKAAALRAELEELESLEIAIKEAEVALEAKERAAMAAAKKLRKAREKAAKSLATQVEAQLLDLAMKGARIAFTMTPRDALGPQGLDSGQILIETNTGEGLKPLVKVASGGELSRVLLSLKSVLAEADDVYVGVFDEVDTGVGGAVADIVGSKLAELAAHRQVIAITHLPQIASQANHHLNVSKSTEDGRTRTSVATLSSDERIDEIARMLGGIDITDKTRAHAAELLTR
ncbi:MAG: DNA repair protein RecN [Myxococcota bacterium]